jgi:Cys-rich four helix bundle protein (predicted Tat secretion target)
MELKMMNRKNFFYFSVAGLFASTSLFSETKEKDEKREGSRYSRAIAAASDVVTSAEICISASIYEMRDGDKAAFDCMRACRECATIAMAFVTIASQDSRLVKESAELCIKACELCAETCRKRKNTTEALACAESCRICIFELRKII